jgi:hypothetical protein
LSVLPEFTRGDCPVVGITFGANNDQAERRAQLCAKKTHPVMSSRLSFCACAIRFRSSRSCEHMHTN